jgi:hypothetical protein
MKIYEIWHKKIQGRAGTSKGLPILAKNLKELKNHLEFKPFKTEIKEAGGLVSEIRIQITKKEDYQPSSMQIALLKLCERFESKIIN